MSIATLGEVESEIRLPAPQVDDRMTLFAALRARRSERAFASRPLSPAVLSSLLWSAFGVNRPDTCGRTAPSTRDWQEIDVYAVLPTAACLYEPHQHVLRTVVRGDVRAATGLQDFVPSAPLNLVYVADRSRMTEASDEDRSFYAATDTGFIAQNVYLACAALGLVSVVRGHVDRKQLALALRLRPDQQVVLAHTVGYPL
jgi:nitroreductase